MTVSVQEKKPASLRTVAEGRLTVYLEPKVITAAKAWAAFSGENVSSLAQRAMLELISREAPDILERVGIEVSDTAQGGTKTPAEAGKRARELKRDGLTIASIADQLNAEGYRTKRGKLWSFGSVQRLLKK